MEVPSFVKWKAVLKTSVNPYDHQQPEKREGWGTGGCQSLAGIIRMGLREERPA